MKTALLFIVLVGACALGAQAGTGVVNCIYDLSIDLIFPASSVPAQLCTHVLVTAIAVLQGGSLDLQDNGPILQSLVNLREQNPALKIVVAVGGSKTSTDVFSCVANDPVERQNLVYAIKNLIYQFDLDGVDVDWHDPNDNGASPEDHENLVTLLQMLRQELARHLILSISVVPTPTAIDQSYNVPQIDIYVTYYNLKAFDYHDFLDGLNVTGVFSPLYSSGRPSDATLNIDYSISLWLSAGATSSKVIFSVSLFGATYTLQDPAQNGVGAPTIGPGAPGVYTNEDGIWSFLEICLAISDPDEVWTTVYDAGEVSAYSYLDDQWVGYDNQQSVAQKCAYARCRRLAGVILAYLAYDDLNDTCGFGAFPLVAACSNVLLNDNC